MNYPLSNKIRNALFEFILGLGDDNLILGHRLSEWCGHAPILEEDVALANIALDCVGQASALLTLAVEVENKGKSEDDLAYFRSEYQFNNFLLVERPNTDFAFTIARQFLYDGFAILYYEDLSKSKFEPLAGIAVKAVKEITYHLRHAKLWMLRLGDGTKESHDKLQNAVNDLWRFTNELFYKNTIDEILFAEDLAPDPDLLKDRYQNIVQETLNEATIEIPKNEFMQIGGRSGKHSEYFGHLLSEMQIIARSYPGAQW